MSGWKGKVILALIVFEFFGMVYAQKVKDQRAYFVAMDRSR